MRRFGINGCLIFDLICVIVRALGMLRPSVCQAWALRALSEHLAAFVSRLGLYPDPSALRIIRGVPI